MSKLFKRFQHWLCSKRGHRWLVVWEDAHRKCARCGKRQWYYACKMDWFDNCGGEYLGPRRDIDIRHAYYPAHSALEYPREART